MSALYGSLKGQGRTEATRRGSATSGSTGHLRGWNLGVEGVGTIDPATGKERFEVYRTGGSGNIRRMALIAEVK